MTVLLLHLVKIDNKSNFWHFFYKGRIRILNTDESVHHATYIKYMVTQKWV